MTDHASDPTAASVFRQMGVDISDRAEVESLGDVIRWARVKRQAEMEARTSFRAGMWAIVGAAVSAMIITIGNFLLGLWKH